MQFGVGPPTSKSRMEGASLEVEAELAHRGQQHAPPSDHPLKEHPQSRPFFFLKRGRSDERQESARYDATRHAPAERVWVIPPASGSTTVLAGGP